MRVGINAALRGTGGGYRQTGVSRYLTELIDALPQAMTSNDELALFGASSPRLSGSPPSRIVWEQTVLPILAARRRVDVLHGPVNVVPWLGRVPSVVTLHDFAFLHYPEHLSAQRRAWLVSATQRSARKAARVITVSQSTADDLSAWLELPAERIAVVPLAPSPSVAPLRDDALAEFCRRQGIDRPFVLAVGTLEPRKNLPTLLRAFARVARELPHDLVLVGPEGWLSDELHRTIGDVRLGDRLRMTGFVSDADLGGWYSAADLFAFPSYYEGFGLPSLEAMRCGVPVVASDSSCFPEIVGDAGVLLDPRDIDGWAEALVTLLRDPARRAELVRRGRARAAGFTWSRTAAETYAVYRSAADTPRL
jgi:glycosyltransferase involved in cell wall biosynthesis